MESASVGCRLCLDPFADNFDSIDNLKEQIHTVFRFVIELKQEWSTTVCQSCSYTVCEFYKFSEKVRVNQEWLAGETIVASNSPADDFKAILISEDVKSEPTAPITMVEVVQGGDDGGEKLELKEESEAETEDNHCPSDDSYKPPVKAPKSTRKRKRQIETLSSEDSDSFDSEDDVELRPRRKPSKDRLKTQEERAKSDQQIKEFYQLICDICGFVLTDYKSLLMHFRDEHKRKGFVVCCKKKLSSRKALHNHIAFHKDPDAFRCNQCNKSYKSFDYLEMHKASIHGEQDKVHPFKCDECDKTFPKKYQLKAHTDKHRKIQCEICKKLLSSTSSLNSHMANQHSEKNRVMICDFCGQEFVNKFCFDRHLNEHKGIEVPKFQCLICLKWYRGERNLQIHTEFTHTQKGRQYPCDVCHQNYPNERAMKKHKRYVHVEEKFECEFCGKRFKQSVNLKEHRTIHTGEVLYSCDYCGVTKNSRANLYVHIKQKHAKEWAERKVRQAEANATL